MLRDVPGHELGHQIIPEVRSVDDGVRLMHRKNRIAGHRRLSGNVAVAIYRNQLGGGDVDFFKNGDSIRQEIGFRAPFRAPKVGVLDIETKSFERPLEPILDRGIRRLDPVYKPFRAGTRA